MDDPQVSHSQRWLGLHASNLVATLPDKAFHLPNVEVPLMNGQSDSLCGQYDIPRRSAESPRSPAVTPDDHYGSMRHTRSQTGAPGSPFTHFGSQSYDSGHRNTHPGYHSSYPGSLVGVIEDPKSPPAKPIHHPGIPNGHFNLLGSESKRLSSRLDHPKSMFDHPRILSDYPANQNGHSNYNNGHFLDFLMKGNITFDQYSPALLHAMLLDAEKSRQVENKSQSQASDSEDSSLKFPQQNTDDESVAGNLLLYGGPTTDQDLYQKVSLLRAELKLVGDDRDSFGDSFNLNNNPPHLTMSSQDKVVEKLIGRDMATLKDKCDRAIKEVDSLKHQLMEATAKREQVHKEADMFKQKYKLMKDQVGQKTNENRTLKGKYKDLTAEKQKLEADVADLQHLRQEAMQEMEELRKQQREVISGSGSSEALNKVYTATVDRYESTKKDYDDLRRKYADLLGSHTTLKTQLEHLQEEDENLKKQLEDIIQGRNEALKQKKALQQQCTSAIMKWNTATKEKGDVETELKLMRKDRDDYKDNFNQVLTEKGKLTKDLVRVRRERDAALHEHHLIMSERDQVHKEMEQLHDKWQDASKKLEGSEKDKKKLQSEMDGLHEEITAALRDRDRAMKQVHEMKDRHLDYNKDRENDPLLDQNSLGHQREGSDRLSSSFDAVSKDGEAKDLANKEKEAAEFLRREVERLQAEVSDALQEAEVSKRRRDWAFGERDKIVMERESIRTWCDKLRRERDRAVSDLAEALRDLDEYKKQKNEALKDLGQFKEKYNSLVEKEARKNQLHAVGHTHSRDSAIDADLQEWETETIELEISNVQPGELGFDLVNGKDEGQLSNDGSVFIGSVSENCSAYGKLRKNDQVLRVNNIDMSNCDKKTAMQAVKSGGRNVNMLVRRRKSSTSRSIQPVHISLLGNRELGISLEHGLYVSRIVPGSAAAREGSLAVGDRIIHVNGHSVENLSINEVMQLVDEEGDFVMFNVLKYTGTPQPSLVSSSASSGQMLLQESSPDMLSISPQSGRSQSWHTTPSPDPKLDLLHMQTSTDSHTDESPSMTSSTGSQHDAGKTLMDRTGISKVFSARHHEPSKTRMTNKSSYLSPASPASPMSTSSATPASPSPVSQSPSPQEEEDAVIGELRDIYKMYSKPSNSKGGLSGKKDKFGIKSDKSKDNGGTWPKCHGPPDFGPTGAFPTVIHAGKKDRPHLSGLFSSDHTDYKAYNQNDSRVPPTPPERSDSFKKGASIKDGPQNTDIVSKYPYRASGTIANVKTIAPGYLTSLSHSQTDAKSSSMDKSAMFDKSNSLPGSCYYPQVSANSCPPSSSSSPASSYMSGVSPPFSPDHTVVSAKADQKDVRSYLHSRRHHHNRPTSAPSGRGRHDRQEFAAPMHITRPPQKPTSLDIQPFSPRPPPHSGHTINPFSQSMSPRDSMSSTSSSCGVGVNPQSPTSTPTSPTHNSMAAVGRLQRTGNPPVQVVSSQRVTHGAGVSSGMSLSLGGGSYGGDSPSPAATSPLHFHHQPPTHPMFSSVPSPQGYHGYSNGHHYPDLPGLHRGGVAAPINYMRYTPSPSPSQQSGTFDSAEDFQRRSVIQDGMAYSSRSVGIPSNPSIYSSVSTTSSFEGALPGDFATLTHPRSSRSLPKNVPSSNTHPRPRPQTGETRSIHIVKSQEPLGIKIEPGPGGGIFVSSVGKHSLASQAGLEVGDQLLEVCGINMRNATYKEAAIVMRQCGDNITMLVQYNPEKYNENDCESSSDTDEESSANNTPQTSRSTQIQHHHAPSDVSTITPDSPQSRSPVHSGKMGPPQCAEEGPSEPRFVFLKKTHSHDNPGISVVGGNVTGIFVSDVLSNSIAAGPQGLRSGDQILEFNGTNFRSATAEQAEFEISKPVETVTILAQYNLAKYTKAQELSGDGFYIRMSYGREVEAEGELRFHKDDILLIDNTKYNKLGVWRAWLVDEEGNKLRCGTIPSKARLEEEITQRRSISDLHEDELKGSRRGSGSARRSFFRKKKHQRSSSKDSRELTSYSDVSINSDSVPYLDVDGSLMTFQRVERLECHSCRPVVLLGPLAEPLINKLTSESPDKYCRCDPELLSVAEMENNADVGWCVDFRRRDDHYECITVTTVKSIMEKNRHCMLNVSPSAIEILHKVDIYPIVLFIKHKSAKQIREVRDTRFLPEKMTNKTAKELFETFQKYETDHKHLFSDIVQGGNLAFMCFKLKAAIDKEQRKILWIPAES